MAKPKQEKFAELATFPNVYQNIDLFKPQLINSNGSNIALKGLWKKNHFKNDNPIVLELACGRGEYSVALAQKFSEKNFIGIDIKGNRIWTGAKAALQQGLNNAAFLRTSIELLYHFFEKGEVSEIWITFPDPFLRNSKSKKRLTSPYFLAVYQKVLADGGLIHLKTDSDPLYEFTLKTIEGEKAKLNERVDDVYEEQPDNEILAIKTYYEGMHLKNGLTIKYVSFRL